MHREIAGTAVADSGDMGRWEALCLLIAFRTWFVVLSASIGSLVAVGDALRMLHGAAKFNSRDPGINLMFMELALIFAPSGATIETMHIWSQENALADAVSRLDEGAVLPPALAKVRRTQLCDGKWRILGHVAAHLRRHKKPRSSVVCE